MGGKQIDMKKSSNDLKQSYMMNKMKDIGSTPVKNQSNPEYLFFESLRNVFDQSIYKTLIKLLHLYNEVYLKIYFRVF
jgi:histone deacetylase complex regulatory component SIN3